MPTEYDLPFRLSLIAGMMIIANGIWVYIQLAYVYSIPFWILEFASVISLLGYGIVVIFSAMKLKEDSTYDKKLLWIALIIAFSIAGYSPYIGTAGTILGVLGGILALRPILEDRNKSFI